MSAVTCLFVQADNFLPLLENDKEWGYVEYGADPVHKKGDIPNFYRIATGESQWSGALKYYSIGTYSRFMYERPYVEAYIREDNGKVYIRYDEKGGQIAGNYYQPGQEYLVYDFTLRPGESCTLTPRDEGEECIVLKCVETGEVETADGKRRFLRFDKNVNETTRKWMAYEYLVEGIGPVGDCDIITPYRLHGATVEWGKLKEKNLLYKRFKGNTDADYDEVGQGEIVYTTPAFELWGVYDPSVWCTPNKASSFDSVDNPTMPVLPDKSITMTHSDNGGHHIVSNGDELTEVTVMDMLGRVLARYQPHAHEFEVDTSRFDASIVIIRAATAKGSRPFKIALR